MSTVSTVSELKHAANNTSSGDEIVVAPGTYEISGSIRFDTPNVTVRAENDAVRGNGGAVSHLVCTGGVSSGGFVELRGRNVTFRGFEVSNSGAKGIELHGFTSGIEVSHCDVHDNRQWGVMTNNGSNHTIRDCDSHDNRGDDGNADGFNGTGSEGVTFLRCRAWNNADDGFDMWSGENHILRECWSWNSGPAGNAEFKLGNADSSVGGGHLVENCVAHSSDMIGFSWNQQPNNPITVRNCTAYNCSPDYRFEDTDHTLENNISSDNSVRCAGSIKEANNTWNAEIDHPQFSSTDANASDFLRLSAGSPCIGAGMDGGDLGAFSYDGDSTSSPGTPGEALTVDGATTLGASAAALSATALESEHAGFNGNGYLNPTTDSGASITWPLEVASAGEYDYTIRYANGDSADRTAQLSVDDTRTEITFPQTDGWSSWAMETGTVELPEGVTELHIETTGEDAGNVDQIVLEPVEADTSGDAVAVDGTATLLAERAKRGATALESDHAGFNGNGYLNPTADSGASVTWPIEVQTPGRYTFTIRYANGDSAARTATLRIGDARQEITFDATEGWADWSTVTGVVDLASGTTELGIETTGEDAGNVDQITLELSEDDSGGAPEPTDGTPNHGYAMPEPGQSDWHVPLNENFEAIDSDVPVVDAEGAKADYEATKGTLFIALDTGTVYVGDGSEWSSIGTLS